MSAAWSRLAADLAAAGVECSVEESRGNERIVLRPEPSGLWRVEVADSWWAKNPNVWTGWSVFLERPDSTIARSWRRSKKRSEVVTNILAALAAGLAYSKEG